MMCTEHMNYEYVNDAPEGEKEKEREEVRDSFPFLGHYGNPDQCIPCFGGHSSQTIQGELVPVQIKRCSQGGQIVCISTMPASRLLSEPAQESDLPTKPIRRSKGSKARHQTLTLVQSLLPAASKHIWDPSHLPHV